MISFALISTATGLSLNGLGHSLRGNYDLPGSTMGVQEELLIPTDGSQFSTGGRCPDNGVEWPVPADGLGLGPQELPSLKERLLTENRACRTCPDCDRKAQVVRSIFYDFGVGRDISNFGAQLSPKNLHTVTGFGPTAHACFGHTYVNGTQFTNACYGALPRLLGELYLGIEDLQMDSCGEKAVANLVCHNCKNFAGEDYPQRYTWILQFTDDAKAPHGFYITRSLEVMDSELTTIDAIQNYPTAVEKGNYLCPLIAAPAAFPAPPAKTMPVSKNVLVPLTVMDHSPVAIDAIGAAGAQKKCAVCPNCEQTMATLKGVFEADPATGTTSVEKLMPLLADDVDWLVSAVGPTRGGCFGARTTGKYALVGAAGKVARMGAMTRQEKMTQAVAPVINIDACGSKANVYVVHSAVGRSGTRYTLSTMLTLYLEADKSSSAGFKITRVVDVEDTEVLQSLATREQAWDVMTCAEVQSEWSDVIVHTAMQP